MNVGPGKTNVFSFSLQLKNLDSWDNLKDQHIFCIQGKVRKDITYLKPLEKVGQAENSEEMVENF